MPVTVNIPIRVRVDPPALGERLPDIEEALAVAVLRALENSRDAVVAQRGGYVGIAIRPPTFTWLGEGLSKVRDETRGEIEVRLTSVIEEQIAGSGILDFAKDAREAPTPMPDGIVESLAEERYIPLIGLYRIPTYEGPAREETIPIENESVEIEVRGGTEIRYRWVKIPSLADYEKALAARIKAGSVEVSSSGCVGFIFYFRGEIGVIIYRPRGDSWQKALVTSWVEPPFYMAPKVEKGKVVFERQTIPFSPGASYRITKLAEATDVDGSKKMLNDLFGKNLESSIRELIGKHKLTLSESDLARLISSTVDLIVKRFVATFGRKSGCIVLLEIGGSAALGYIEQNPDLPLGESIPLNALVEEIAVKPGEKKGEGEAGEGAKKGGVGAGPPKKGTGEGEEERPGEGGGVGAGIGGEMGEGEGEGVAVEVPARIGVEGGEAEEGEMAYPRAEGKSGDVLTCEPFLGEPSLDELGDAGIFLRSLIERIANSLLIPTCKYAGRFCLNAARALEGRAAGVAGYAAEEPGFTQLAPNTSGNFGDVEFTPEPSPAIMYMQLLAGITPYITQLSRCVPEVYKQDKHKWKIKGLYSGDPSGWHYQFLLEFSPRIKRSAGFIFGLTCQVVMLQLLRSTREALSARHHNPKYAEYFEQLIIPQLLSVQYLHDLRDRLNHFIRLTGVKEAVKKVESFLPAVVAPMRTAAEWARATTEILGLIEDSMKTPAGGASRPGDIVVEKNLAKIYDKEGRLWTLDGLERAIVRRRGMAEYFDPFVKQIIDLKSALERFKNPTGGVQAELDRFLGELLAKNAEVTAEAKESWIYAFRASKIREDLPGRTIPYSSFSLQGVHKLAHDQIGRFFEGDRVYGDAVDSLFKSELGFEALTGFFFFAGEIFLAVVCPPLAIAFGMAVSLYEYRKAVEREEIYAALIDPELILDRAEVETELFMVHLGLALSFIPEIGRILGRGAKAAMRLGGRGSLLAAGEAGGKLIKGGARGAVRSVRHSLTDAMAEQLKEGLEKALVKELVSDQFMDQMLQLVITPYLKGLEHEIMVIGPSGGTTGAAERIRYLEAREKGKSPGKPKRPLEEGGSGG